MARRPNAVPSYRHHKGSSQAFVEIKGRQIYLGRWGMAESREALAKIVSQYSAAQAVQAAPPLLAPKHDLTVVEVLAA